MLILWEASIDNLTSWCTANSRSFFKRRECIKVKSVSIWKAYQYESVSILKEYQYEKRIKLLVSQVQCWLLLRDQHESRCWEKACEVLFCTQYFPLKRINAQLAFYNWSNKWATFKSTEIYRENWLYFWLELAIWSNAPPLTSHLTPLTKLGGNICII